MFAALADTWTYCRHPVEVPLRPYHALLGQSARRSRLGLTAHNNEYRVAGCPLRLASYKTRLGLAFLATNVIG